MGVRVVRSARWHGLSVRRVREALRVAELVEVDGDAAKYVGVDSRGLGIEMVVVPDNRNVGGLAVIHAMPVIWRRR